VVKRSAALQSQTAVRRLSASCKLALLTAVLWSINRKKYVMFTRRLVCGCLAAGGALLARGVHANSPSTPANTPVGPACEIFTPDRQKALSPDAALQRLFDGNKRFVDGNPVNCDLPRQVNGTAHGQAPFATVLGCIDSRVPPELVFDQHIGDLFAARVAGNFSSPDILGSLEFATRVAGSKLIVVLGHTQCGAIKGAIDRVSLGNLTGMLKRFDPALNAVANVPGERSSKNHELVDAACAANARLTAASMTKESDVLNDLVQKGDLKIVAALHDLETGKVALLT
jgi:carbonic anhydrase